MSAEDHLSPHQFMPLAELRKTYSGDYHVPITRVEREMHGYYNRWQRGEEWEKPHGRHIEHGGPGGYIRHLTEQIRTQGGIQTPIRIRNENVIDDGHHRALAALRLGIDPVPVEHIR